MKMKKKKKATKTLNFVAGYKLSPSWMNDAIEDMKRKLANAGSS